MVNKIDKNDFLKDPQKRVLKSPGNITHRKNSCAVVQNREVEVASGYYHSGCELNRSFDLWEHCYCLYDYITEGGLVENIVQKKKGTKTCNYILDLSILLTRHM